jgi:hypothetical protein
MISRHIRLFRHLHVTPMRELGGSQRLSQVRLRPASNECGH